jgi:hypothetical protein
MPENHDGTWREPQLPEFCGPLDLARVIVDFRRWTADTGPGGAPEPPRARVSDDGLAKLLKLAYYASFEPDEGRYLRLRLFAPDAPPAGRPRAVVRFATPLPLKGTEEIRRLGPALGSHAYAAEVDERDGRLFCDGIVAVDDGGADSPVGDPGTAASAGCRGLMVRVEGPGELRVSEGMADTYELRGGRIRRVQPFHLARMVDDWLRGLGAALAARCSPGDGADPAAGVHPLLRSAWSHVLMAAAALRHGGLFVVLAGPACADIDVKFRVSDIRLGDEVVAFWDACARARRTTDGPGFADAAREWSRHKHRLFSAARALGHLSAVDGCVVLDRELNLLGFGGEIRVDNARLQQASRVFAHYRTRRPRPEEELRRFGTRHNSAYRLCKAHAGTLAFVLSQDGALRVFASDAGHVYLPEPLSPAVNPADVW